MRFLLLYYWDGRQEREKEVHSHAGRGANTQACGGKAGAAQLAPLPGRFSGATRSSRERRNGSSGRVPQPRPRGQERREAAGTGSALPRAPLPAPPCPLRTGWAARGLGGERETSRSGTRRPHLPGPRRGSTGTSGQTGLGGGASAGHTSGAGPGLPRPATDTGGLEPSCPAPPRRAAVSGPGPAAARHSPVAAAPPAQAKHAPLPPPRPHLRAGNALRRS